MKPTVSVIMPVFNCEIYIAQALESILNQSYKDLEVLVCDDASTDRTWDILCSFNDARIKRFKNETNRGVILTKNFLLEKSTGEYLCIQDGDDWSNLNRIEVQLKEFLSDQSLSACGTNAFRVSNQGKLSRFKTTKTGYITIKECNNLPFMPASLMIKREVFEKVGGFNPFFAGLLAEDLYWVALITEQFKVLYIGDPLYYYRFNQNSITNTFDRKEKLVITDLIAELVSQRIEKGTDWVEKGDKISIQDFIQNKFSDSRWLSEKYRVMAAVQRDGKKRILALKLIYKALCLNPFVLKNYVTLRYILTL